LGEECRQSSLDGKLLGKRKQLTMRFSVCSEKKTTFFCSASKEKRYFREGVVKKKKACKKDKYPKNRRNRNIRPERKALPKDVKETKKKKGARLTFYRTQQKSPGCTGERKLWEKETAPNRNEGTLRGVTF